jgi:hypothetical protein
MRNSQATIIPVGSSAVHMIDLADLVIVGAIHRGAFKNSGSTPA